MQTFYVSTDYEETARLLDRQRLGKQRVEALQIMKALVTGKGWIHHPATKMWAGYEWALYRYYHAVRDEWLRRGYKDNTLESMYGLVIQTVDENAGPSVAPRPDWHFDDRVIQSHKYNLYRKDPVHYAQWAGIENITCCDRCNYYWPTHVKETANA